MEPNFLLTGFCVRIVSIPNECTRGKFTRREEGQLVIGWENMYDMFKVVHRHYILDVLYHGMV